MKKIALITTVLLLAGCTSMGMRHGSSGTTARNTSGGSMSSGGGTVVSSGGGYDLVGTQSSQSGTFPLEGTSQMQR